MTDTAGTQIASKTSSVAAGSVGNFLEFYNFVAYAFFASMIGAAFFPGHDDLARLLGAFMAFGAGFLARPLGAIVIGRYAERRGNRAALTLTLSLMACGALIIACTPGYSTIGLAAPALIVFARLIQGFSEGGEVGPATDFLYSLGSGRMAGVYAAMQPTTQMIASLVAVSIGLGLSFGLDHDALYAWGWRVPFACGLLVVPAGIYLRRAQKDDHAAHAPHTHGRIDPVNVALVFLIVTCGTITTYLRTFGVSYAITALHLSPRVGMATGAIGMVFGIVATAFSIWAFLRLNPWAILIPFGALYALAAYPAYGFAVHSPGLFSQVVLNIAMFSGSAVISVLMYSVMLGAIPAGSRAFVFGLAYTLAVTVFGGATTPAVTWAIRRLHDPMIPGYLSLLVIPTLLVAVGVLGRRSGLMERRA
jgi:MFS transporter, MHS family, proline/betaine transporter